MMLKKVIKNLCPIFCLSEPVVVIYFQYFINTADSDVEYYLKLFTFLSEDEIDNLLRKHKVNSCLEVIKLEFILRLKIKPNDWLLADTCLKLYNLKAWFIRCQKRKA